MPGFMVNVAALIRCPHGGNIQIVPSQPRVSVNGQPIATVASPAAVAGCQSIQAPCLRVQWVTGAARVRILGVPALLSDSTGVCTTANGLPQGGPIIISTQVRVRGV